MIRRVSIANFRCIRQLTTTLEPLTVLVGPNASGKSSFLQALIARGNTQAHEQWRQTTQTVVVTCELETGQSIRLCPFAGGATPRYAIFHFDVARLRDANQVAEEHALSSDGRNLANVFATLTRNTKAAIAKELARLVPVFDDVDVRPTNQGMHRLIFHDRWADVWYAPDDVSDGTMLVLALLVLQRQRDALDIIAIEEPERGLHPWLLGQVLDVLHAMSRGELGAHEVQVLLATHSAELLEFVKPEEVRFFDRKTEDGSVRVTEAPTKSSEWKAAFDEYRESLGEAWLSGGLGGV